MANEDTYEKYELARLNYQMGKMSVIHTLYTMWGISSIPQSHKKRIYYKLSQKISLYLSPMENK